MAAVPETHSILVVRVRPGPVEVIAETNGAGPILAVALRMAEPGCLVVARAAAEEMPALAAALGRFDADAGRAVDTIIPTLVPSSPFLVVPGRFERGWVKRARALRALSRPLSQLERQMVGTLELIERARRTLDVSARIRRARVLRRVG